ncbi:MAG: branched chain amino acid aminotransferase, partial [Cobetia crustatorum]
MTKGFDVRASTQPADAAVRDTILANPGFGRHFSDHMAHVRWTVDGGWHGHEVR